jgi:hypothetical protein
MRLLEMKTSHKISIALAMLVLAVIVWFALGATRADHSATAVSQATQLPKDPNAVVVPASASFDLGKRPAMPQDHIKAIAARRPSIRMDEAQLQQALNKTEITQRADPKAVFQALPWLTEKQRSDGRQFVAYEPYVLESKFVGDRLDILIPEVGIIGQGIVDSVEILDQDIVRWQGHFDNFNDTQNRFTITQTLGDRYAVATYETPYGNFSMESKDGYGWVVSQQTDFHLPENGKDYVVPDHDSH